VTASTPIVDCLEEEQAGATRRGCMYTEEESAGARGRSLLQLLLGT